MTNKSLVLPFYVKGSIFLIGVYVLISMLYIAQSIIIPLVFAFIIAILLNPVVNFLISKKVNKLLSIIITLLLFIILFIGLASFLVWQISGFGESWPIFVDKFTEMINQSINTLSQYINIDPQYIYDWITKIGTDAIDNNGIIIGQKLVSFGSAMLSFFLIPIYIFFILFYKSLLLEFICQLFSQKAQPKVNEIITEIKTVVQRYLIGLIIQLAIVAVLNSVGLLIIGIDYAILIGVLGALLNLIPYIGGVVAVALPMMIALATKSTAWYAFYVLALYMLVQLIDNNYIVPKIVASRVQINALFSIIIVLAGNALWGVSGMFLSIPLLAIMKLIFDRIDGLKPWGFLLGDTMPNILKLKGVSKKKKRNQYKIKRQMKIICVGRNYLAHIKELNHPIPEEPLFFLKPDSALLQKNSPFFYPDFSNNVHYECELVIRINRLGKSIPEKYARKYYSEIALGLDMTCRDIQEKEIASSSPWSISKVFDYSAPMSQFIELETLGKDIQDVNFKLEKNKVLVQETNTSDMIFTVDKIISYLSQFMTLKIGDLIFTGTPCGVGEVKIGDSLEGFLEGNPILKCDIK